jgi:hypothetical protein
MTIFLPNEPQAFREAFDRACDRIVGSKQDRVFYSLYAALLEALRAHPLVGTYFFGFEKTAEKMDLEFSEAAFHAMEEEWILLWKTHPKNGRVRIELAKIKATITRPGVVAFNSLFHQINCSFFHLRFLSSFRGTPENGYLVSNKRLDLMTKASISGNDVFEKRSTMRAGAAIDPSFCWSRMKFFLNCWQFNEEVSLPQRAKGSWEETGRTAWNAMWSACDKMVYLSTKMDLDNALSDPRHQPSPFINAEHQIIRKDYEEYLAALKQHLWNHLLELEQTLAEQNASVATEEEENPFLELPGTQNKDFVIDLAHKFWTKDPLGKRDAAYEYYCAHCPFSKILQRDRWDQIVRKRKLDHRPREARKRGPGKKTCKK